MLAHLHPRNARGGGRISGRLMRVINTHAVVLTHSRQVALALAVAILGAVNHQRVIDRTGHGEIASELAQHR